MVAAWAGNGEIPEEETVEAGDAVAGDVEEAGVDLGIPYYGY